MEAEKIKEHPRPDGRTYGSTLYPESRHCYYHPMMADPDRTESDNAPLAQGVVQNTDSSTTVGNPGAAPLLRDYETAIPVKVTRAEPVVKVSKVSNLTSLDLEDPDSEPCGWGRFRPSCCQRFRDPRIVLVCLCLAGCVQVGIWFS